MTTAALKHAKLNPQTCWETLSIPPLREREEFKSRARKCMREKKISMDQMVIFTCFVDYGTITEKLLDPSKGGYDQNRGLVAGMDELCEITCEDLQIPPEKVVEAARLFVELDLLQGLTLERAP